MDNVVPLLVALQKCEVYDRAAISALVEKMAVHLDIAGSLYGKVVLLKPNLISGGGQPHCCTNPEFIAGVASWFLDQGAKVFLGDSPAFGSAKHVCDKQGITDALKDMNVVLVNFETPVKRKLACGLDVTIAEEALQCDLFVGLPKVKAHNQMYVTLAVKNIFGIVKGVNKGMLHMVHGKSHDRFAEIILDLLPLLPPQLHVVDGIEAMHRSGPLDGSPFPLHCIAAACSPVALDTTLLDVLKLDRKKSPLWRVAARRKQLGSDHRLLQYPELSPKDFHGSRFVAPDVLNPVRFNPFRFLSGMLKRIFLKEGGLTYGK